MQGHDEPLREDNVYLGFRCPSYTTVSYTHLMPLHLVSVDEHSPAQRLGLEPGCTLLAIDGNPLNDALDYQFYTSCLSLIHI